MAERRFRSRQDDSTYTDRQVKAVLKALGIKVEDSTGTVYITYCPIHRNRDTPSFAVNKTTGTFICFNPSCAESGNLTKLITIMLKCNGFEALRFVYANAGDQADNFEDDLRFALEQTKEWEEFDPDLLRKLESNIDQGRDYLHGRGFTDATISRFRVGYSVRMAMVTVPVHSPDGIPVGFIGRSVEGKEFKNSTGLPTSRAVFNLHRAKRESGTGIVTEASFDAMGLDQIGYPNGVALMNGYLSPVKAALLDRHFDRLIIATDFDKLQFKEHCKKCLPKLECQGHNPGRDLGYQIESLLGHKEILWASYKHGVVYPNGAKDLSDLSEKDRAQVIENAVPSIDYHSWGIY